MIPLGRYEATLDFYLGRSGDLNPEIQILLHEGEFVDVVDQDLIVYDVRQRPAPALAAVIERGWLVFVGASPNAATYDPSDLLDCWGEPPGVAPVSVQDALDRIASVICTHLGVPIP